MRHNRYGLKVLGALAMICGALTGVLSASQPAQAATKSKTYYVSLGDSYSVGYQPGSGPRRATPL